MEVLIIMGSKSDKEHADKAREVLNKIPEIGVSMRIGSAHRTPEYVKGIVRGAEDIGTDVIIAIAGMSAALPGVIASLTIIPVIGVPVESGSLCGLDALLSIVQMPSGVPVACMGVNGAKNAAYYALRLLAFKYGEKVQDKVLDIVAKQANAVKEDDGNIQEL